MESCAFTAKTYSSTHNAHTHTHTPLALPPTHSLPLLCHTQVDGCSEDLSELKPYFRRSKICPSHQGAPTVLLGGVVCRFCQQCTRCHPLDEFDGTKR